MSISSEISRLQNAKENLKTAINDKLAEEVHIEDETLDNYAEFVNTIPVGIDTSDATVTADDIINPKTAYVNGEKITGTIIPTYGDVGTDYQFLETPLNIGVITKIALRNSILMACTTDNKLYLIDIATKDKVSYTFEQLGVTTIDEIDISRLDTKCIIRSDTDVYLYQLNGLSIDLLSRTKLDYTYCNFTELDNRAIAGIDSVPSVAGTTKLLLFGDNLEFSVKEILGGRWYHPGKATPQGYAVNLANYWHSQDVNTTYAIDNSSNDVIAELLAVAYSSPNNKYLVSYSDNTFQLYDATTAASIKQFSIVSTPTSFMFHDDNSLFVFSSSTLRSYDYIQNKVLDERTFITPINTTLAAVSNGEFYAITTDNSLASFATIKHISGLRRDGVSYIDTSDATVTADDVIAPKTAYVNGEKITGNINLSNHNIGAIGLENLDITKIYSNPSCMNADNILITKVGNTLYIYKSVDGVSNLILSRDSFFSDTVYELKISNSITTSIGVSYLIAVTYGTNAKVKHNTVFYELFYSNNSYSLLDTSITSPTDSYYNGTYGVTVDFYCNPNNIIMFATGGGNNTATNIYLISLGDTNHFTGDKILLNHYQYSESGGDINGQYWKEIKVLNTTDRAILVMNQTAGVNRNVIIEATTSGSVNNLVNRSGINSSLESIDYLSTYDSYIVCQVEGSALNLRTAIISNNSISYGDIRSSITISSNIQYIRVYAENDCLLVTCYNNSSKNKYIYVIQVDENFKMTLINTISGIVYSTTGFVNDSFRNDNGCNICLQSSLTQNFFSYYTVNSVIIDHVNIYNSDLYNTLNADILSSDVLVDKIAYGSVGKLIGTMPDNGALNYTPTTSEQIIPNGYTSGGTIAAVDSSIDPNILPENIKKDVTILNVVGTLESDSAPSMKQFATIAEMQADPTAQLDDLAVVYSSSGTRSQFYGVFKYNGSEYEVAPSQLTTLASDVYKNIFYGANGVETGALTENVSDSFTDTNAEVFNALQTAYDNMTPRVLTDSNKSISTQITIIPTKRDGTPLLDTSSVTNMQQLFNNCSKLTAVPALDTSKALSMSAMFSWCKQLRTVASLDTSKVTNMDGMFSQCFNLTTVLGLSTGEVTNMHNMFNGCSSLTAVPSMDTSKVTNMSNMFQSCGALTAVPSMDTSKVTNMSDMFNTCPSLIIAPSMDTSKVTNMSSMFCYCSKITTIPCLDASNVIQLDRFVDSCAALTDFSGLANLGQAYLTTAAANDYRYTLSVSGSPLLTHESLIAIINNLYDIASKGCAVQQLILGAANLAKLTAEEIEVATTKGWSVS